LPDGDRTKRNPRWLQRLPSALEERLEVESEIAGREAGDIDDVGGGTTCYLKHAVCIMQFIPLQMLYLPLDSELLDLF
jgi:hypothetical protein